MTHDRKLKAISRFLSFVLRHGPDKIGIKLDANGWAGIDELIAKAGRHGRRLAPDLIRTVVASSEKHRFANSSDGHPHWITSWETRDMENIGADNARGGLRVLSLG